MKIIIFRVISEVIVILLVAKLEISDDFYIDILGKLFIVSIFHGILSFLIALLVGHKGLR